MTKTTEGYGSDSSDKDKDKENEDANNNSEEEDHNDIAHISKKELRDIALAAAKTALLMSKQTTRKIQCGNKAKMTNRTALQKEREMDEGWE